MEATAAILTTGGYAGLFPTTSSSASVTGQGLLAAALAGAVLADMEFMQFHPTVLPASGELISEAVRGAGAVLRDPYGQRFMFQIHPDAELTPRDDVSRACSEVMRRVDAESVFLDATVIEHRDGPGTLARRFPQLTKTLACQQFDHVQHLMTAHLGISRDHEGLARLLSELEKIADPAGALVRSIATAALTRTASRGGHWRTDYPVPDPDQAARTAWRLATTQHTSEDSGRAHLVKEHPLHVDA